MALLYHRTGHSRLEATVSARRLAWKAEQEGADAANVDTARINSFLKKDCNFTDLLSVLILIGGDTVRTKRKCGLPEFCRCLSDVGRRGGGLENECRDVFHQSEG